MSRFRVKTQPDGTAAIERRQWFLFWKPIGYGPAAAMIRIAMELERLR